MSYIEGDSAVIHVEVKDSDGTLVDPSSVAFKYRIDGGALVTLTYGTDPEVTKTSAGKYQVALNLGAPGQYAYRWESISPNAAWEGSMQVGKSQVL